MFRKDALALKHCFIIPLFRCCVIAVGFTNVADTYSQGAPG